MIRRMIGATVGVAAMGARLVAQSPATPTTQAGQCQAASGAYINTKADSIRKAGGRLTSAIMAPVQTEAKRMARECAAAIRVSGASAVELNALVSLYLYTNDTAKAVATMGELGSRKGLSEADQTSADLAALRLSIATFDPFKGINPEAEKIVARIDRRSDAVLRQKLSAHNSLMGRYDYADIDDGLIDHAKRLLVLARHALDTKALGTVPARAGVPAFDSAYIYMAAAYSEIVRGAGDFLHADSALKLLDQEERVLGPAKAIAFDLEAQRAMYRLVGTKATPIEGKWWVNGADDETLMPGSNKVTLIQFTAHWCVPCKNSYPGFLRLSNRFAGKPFESVMETQLYGYIGAKVNLTPEQEVAEDREYYAKTHELPFKVAINPQPRDTSVQDTERRYQVNGIPQIVVVDEKGIIRATVTGWDKGNEQRLGGLIERLLREK